MTTEGDFSEQEWKSVLQGPPSAGMIVITAQRGGTFRESFSIAKAYTEARQRRGDSELLDEVAAAKPEMDHKRFRSIDELEQHALQRIRDAVALVETKADPTEVEEYRGFIVELAERVAEAHREGFLGLSGDRVSESESGAIAKVREAAGASA